mmetsp:Transcript_66499/g.150101  ORF Transcript_66499/g.150101 Transcript_66499/m.150101 type:complete len:390 (+) Transcript_66499:522-1691(+)
MDAHHVHGLLLQGALDELDDLAAVQPAERLALLDADAAGDHRVLGDLHEGPGQVDKLLLGEEALVLVVKGAEDLGQVLVRGHAVLLILRLCIGIGLLRLLVTLLEEGHKLSLVDLAVLVGVNLREQLLVALLVHVAVVSEHGQGLCLQDEELRGLLDFGVVAEPRREVRCPGESDVEADHLGLKLLHLHCDPHLQVRVNILTQLRGILLRLGRLLFGLLDGLVHLVGELDHVGRHQGLGLHRQRVGLALGLVNQLGGADHQLLDLADLLLQVRLHLSEFLLPLLPLGLAVDIHRLLALHADGNLQALEALLLHALLALWDEDPEDGLHGGVRHGEAELALGILEGLPAAEEAVLVCVVLVEEGPNGVELLASERLLHGLLLGVSGSREH